MLPIRTALGALCLVAALVLSACSGNSGSANTTIEGSTPATAGEDNTGGDSPISGDARRSETATTTEAEETAQNQLVIAISNNPDEARYQQGVMSVPPGTPFVVNYNNPSQEEHNWVLVEPGQEQAVADAAEANGGNPEGIPGVIAWSETIAGTDTMIDVPPLEQGGYPYICTVPGHFEAGHKGALDVL